MTIAVLVIEKDAPTCETILSMLEALKYRAVGTQAAQNALGALHGVHFDVVMCSLSHDDPEGSLIAYEAKALQEHLKVIVISGRGREKDFAPLVDAFIPKPFTLQAIDHAIKQVLPVSILTTTDRDTFMIRARDE
jgi:DNA-binding NtrC family response regulator